MIFSIIECVYQCSRVALLDMSIDGISYVSLITTQKVLFDSL